MSRLTLGSLFDGIGGFPLAGTMCGITPVWASEIEPFPLKVTAARFPQMRQLGSVTEINGAEIEPVDIITFGSPCQDLSVAGSQKGIHDGERSNLFFEAIRIIKEMRERDERAGRTGVDIRPRWAVWENVPGAFSSNRGDDFRAVLEAFACIREDGLSIPRPKRWSHAGCMVGHGWSVAWRVYDAQYWGVPQRRKRIYLVADFATERAGEILFERESVRGDTAESRTSGEGTSADAQGGAGGGCWAVYDARGNGEGTISPTATGDHGNRITDYTAVVFHGAQVTSAVNRQNPQPGDPAPTLSTCSDSDYVVGRSGRKYIVRRLTPTECARLQGFPDRWCEGLGGSDSAIYKAYGNGLALPCAYDVLSRIAREMEGDK